MLKIILALSVFFAMTQPILATEAKIGYEGVWKGTIGKNEIRFCSHGTYGEYYYRKTRMGISLTIDEAKSEQWLEYVKRDNTGIWQPKTITPGNISGTWINPGNTKEFPFKIQKIAELKDSECGHVYFKPLLDAIEYKITDEVILSHKMKSVTTDAAVGFYLPAQFKGASKINKYVDDWLKNQAIEFYNCQINGGGDGYDKSLRPTFVDNNFLTVEDNLGETYCGGAHNDYGTENYVLDLNSGSHIDIWSWIEGGRDALDKGWRYAVEIKAETSQQKNENIEDAKQASDNTLQETQDSVQSNTQGAAQGPQETTINESSSEQSMQIVTVETAGSIGAILWAMLERDSPDEDCSDPYFDSPTLSSEGMAFPLSYAHAIRRCNTVLTIPYDQLEVFLTPLGKAGIAKLIGKK